MAIIHWINDWIRENEQRIADWNSFSDEITDIPIFWSVTLNRKREGVPLSECWTDHYLYTDKNNISIQNLFLSYEAAENEMTRLNKEHPDELLRVERVSLSSVIGNSAYQARIVNFEGLIAYICNAKFCYPDNYMTLFPDVYGDKDDEAEVLPDSSSEDRGHDISENPLEEPDINPNNSLYYINQNKSHI